MKKYINKYLIVALSAILIFLCQCSKNNWDNHYKAPASNQLKNIISGLREKGYNEFASALVRANLDSSINSGIQLTIFAVKDDIFKQATANLSGYDLQFFILNHILAGKFYTSSFKNIRYMALGGSILYINPDSVVNYNKESVKFSTNTNIDIPGGVINELTKCIDVLPDLYHDFSSYYPFMYSFIGPYLGPNTVPFPQIVGITPSGLVVNSVYQYNKVFKLTGATNNLCFIASKDDYFVNAYNQQLSQLLPYFIGQDSVIINDLATNISHKHSVLSSTLNASSDTLIVKNIVSNTYRFPVSKVKQLGFDNGNKLLVIDTLMYYYKVRLIKNLKFKSSLVTNYKGALGIGADSIVNWKSSPNIGDFVEFAFPKDSIYTKDYKINLFYRYKSSYVAVKIYIDGDSIGRFDLGAQNLSHNGSIYSYNLATDKVMKYQKHTVRFEVTGVKPGNGTEIMDILRLGFTLNN